MTSHPTFTDSWNWMKHNLHRFLTWQAEGQACADPGARTPNRWQRKLFLFSQTKPEWFNKGFLNVCLNTGTCCWYEMFSGHIKGNELISFENINSGILFCRQTISIFKSNIISRYALTPTLHLSQVSSRFDRWPTWIILDLVICHYVNTTYIEAGVNIVT